MKISYENSSGSLMIRLIGDVDDNGIIKARQDIDRLLEKEILRSRVRFFGREFYGQHRYRHASRTI